MPKQVITGCPSADTSPKSMGCAAATSGRARTAATCAGVTELKNKSDTLRSNTRWSLSVFRMRSNIPIAPCTTARMVSIAATPKAMPATPIRARRR